MHTKIYYNTGVNADNQAGTDWSNFTWANGLDSVKTLFTSYWSDYPLQDPFHMHRPADNYHLVQPMPYVSLSEEMIHEGSRRRQVTSISLEGQLTGDEHADLMVYEEQLMNNFHGQHKPFVIVEDDEVIFASASARVNSINFDSSKHVGIVDYSIDLICNNAGDTSKFTDSDDKYVADLEDSFSFNDNGDGTASMSHSISARGLRPNTYSIADARNWVLSKRGWDRQVYPSYVPFESMPLLMGESQSEDTTNGTFSLTEEYLYNVHKGKVSYGGGGTWEAIAYGIKHGVPVEATFSFAAAGQQIGPNSCAPSTTSETTPAAEASTTFKNGTAAAFGHWSDVFHSAFPEAYSRGFRLNFTNRGVETLNNFSVQNMKGVYSLAVGSEAYNAGIGDFRCAEVTNVENQGGYAGCSQFPEDSVGFFGISGGGGGDFWAASRDFDDAGCGTTSRGVIFEAAHLAFHELGHSLGFGHDRDDSNLTIMSYAQGAWKGGPLNHDDDKCVSIDDWYPDGPENHVQIMTQVRAMYGPDGYAARPIITISSSVDESVAGEFDSVSATITLRGGQTWSQDDLREYVKANRYWHPGVRGCDLNCSSDLSDTAAAGAPWYDTDGNGPEYKSLFHLVQAVSPNWVAPYLNPRAVSYSIDERATDAIATHASELTINVVYDTNTIFDNSVDSVGVGNDVDVNAYFDYSVDINYDAITKISDVSIDGKIVARAGNLNQAGNIIVGLEENSAFTDSARGTLYEAERFFSAITDLQFYLYAKANLIYGAWAGWPNDDGLPCWTLNPVADNISVNRNPFNGEITMAASFNNKDWIKPDFLGGGIKNLSWDMSLKPGLPHFEKTASYNRNGVYLIYDIDVIKREMIDVSIKAEYNRGADENSLAQRTAALKRGTDDVIGYMYSNYFFLKYPPAPSLLDSKNPKILGETIGYNEVERSIDLKASFSQEGLGNNIYYPPNKTIIWGRYVG